MGIRIKLIILGKPIRKVVRESGSCPKTRASTTGQEKQQEQRPRIPEIY